MIRCQRGTDPEDVRECPHCEDPELYGACDRNEPSEVETDDEEEWDGWVEDDDAELDFADPGGRSALRAATAEDPRIHPCPSCGAENRLTGRDVGLVYQCDDCADRAEGLRFD